MAEKESLVRLMQRAIERKSFVRYDNLEIGYITFNDFSRFKSWQMPEFSNQPWFSKIAELLELYYFEPAGQQGNKYFFYRRITPEITEHKFKNLQQLYDEIKRLL